MKIQEEMEEEFEGKEVSELLEEDQVNEVKVNHLLEEQSGGNKIERVREMLMEVNIINNINKKRTMTHSDSKKKDIMICDIEMSQEEKDEILDYTRKVAKSNPNKLFPTKDFGGYMGGITLIIIGFLMLFNKISL